MSFPLRRISPAMWGYSTYNIPSPMHYGPQIQHTYPFSQPFGYSPNVPVFSVPQSPMHGYSPCFYSPYNLQRYARFAPHSFNGYSSPCPYQHYTPSPVCTNIPDDILFDTLDSTDVLFTNDCSEFSDTTSTRNEFFTKRLRPLSKPEPDLQFDTDINTITISPSPAAKTDDLASTPSAHIDIVDDSNINLLTKCCQVLFPLLIAYRSSEHQHETSGTGRLGWFRHVKQLFTSDDFIYLNSKFHFTNSDTTYSYIASIDGVSLHYNLSDPSSLQSLLFF